MTTHILLPVHPIETAPRDGTWVLLHGGPLVKPEIGRWATGYNGHGDCWMNDAKFMHAPFTHWSPLPNLFAPPDLDAMADVLRSEGYVVDVRLNVGQVWMTPFDNQMTREVTFVGHGPFVASEPKRVEFRQRSVDDRLGQHHWSFVPDFLAWARRTGARVRS